MKKIVVTSIMIFVCALSFGQKTNQIKMYHGSVGGNYSYQQDLDGAGWSQSFNTNEIGIRYNKKISKHFRLETGFNYFASEVSVIGAPMPEQETFKDKVQLATFPAYLIAEFGKYFYANSGLFFDFQTKDTKYLTSQSGIGLAFGLGAKYEYNDFMLYINPEIRRHRVIGFQRHNNPEFLFNTSIQAGFGYSF